MTDQNIDLKSLIFEAWNNTPKSRDRSNPEKSSDWIGCLGTSFQGHYNDGDRRVFWRQTEARWRGITRSKATNLNL